MIFEIAGITSDNWRVDIIKPLTQQQNVALLNQPGYDIGERRLQRRRSFGDEFWFCK